MAISARLVGAKFVRSLLDAERAPTRSRYGAKRTWQDGVWFDSKWEATVWSQLLLRARLGEILHLRRQVAFPLHIWTPQGKACLTRYVADFVWTEGGAQVVGDAKGVRTREYLLKRKWMYAEHGITIVEFHRPARRPRRR